VALPAPGGQPALTQLLSDIVSTPLDRLQPLWQVHVIDGVDGGSALVTRFHHCIGDGIALTSVMLSITDGGSDPPRRRRKAAVEDDAEHDWLADAVLKPLTDLTIKAIGMYGNGVGKSMEALAHPTQPLLSSVGMARSGLQVAQDVAALALMADDSPTLLKGKPSGRKVVAWSEPMPLEAVKSVGKGLGCTVNDVLLACAAGAIGGWLGGVGISTAITPLCGLTVPSV
jgi:hypothetical protein